MTGLSTDEALKLLEKNGYNCISEDKKTRPISIFANQFRDIMVIILLAATAVSVVLGEIYDSVTIILIVLLNAISGFIQEYKTEKTLEELKKMTAPAAKVYRDGVLKTIDAEQIVVSDVTELQTGDRIPADCCIISSSGLRTDESILTGEPVSVEKYASSAADKDNSLNKPNILYAGTVVTGGHATAEVIAAGRDTQMGKISDMISDIDPGLTPLQKRLAELGKTVAFICIAVCVIVFAAGILRGENIMDMLMTSITIAIAAIPEGLPATVTIVLALSVNRMLKQKALVNKLHSVETLGCTSVICTDKTGTVTENKMTVTEIFSDLKEYHTEGKGYRIAGAILDSDDHPVNTASDPDLRKLLTAFVLCSTSEISSDVPLNTRNRARTDADGEWKVSGDPTETALLIAAAKGGIFKSSISESHTVINESPFDSQKKYMSVTVKNSSENIVMYMKGAPDIILRKCTFIRINGEISPLTPGIRKIIEARIRKYSDDALRVLGFAVKTCSTPECSESDMVFTGLCGMIDPVRPEARKAIRLCRNASINTVMITGDHINTASAIAKQAGILRGKKAMTGEELDRLSDEKLDECINEYTVFARVNPSHKLRLVRAYKKKGHIVTMTGDGVNDAPAIKEADVGVAMGKTGTDVTKQAADVILLDDNFATLVRAVEQGRCIYSNIRKFVRYLLSCNIGEVITMFFGISFGMPIVLIPTQLLLVNLITDGLPAISLGVEPFDENEMKRPPRRSSDSFFAGGLLRKIIFRGIMIGICTLGSFTSAIRMTGDLQISRTCALVTLIISQLLHVFECKSETGNIFTVKYFNNSKLLAAVLFSAAVTAASIYLAPLQKVFSTSPLSGKQLILSLAFATVIPLISCFFNNNKKEC